MIATTEKLRDSALETSRANDEWMKLIYICAVCFSLHSFSHLLIPSDPLRQH